MATAMWTLYWCHLCDREVASPNDEAHDISMHMIRKAPAVREEAS